MTPTFLSFLDELFPRSMIYRKAVCPLVVRETSEPFRVFPYRERHIQCLWADSRFRPTGLKTSSGEAVVVEHPGDWNLEAGPDFLRAVLLVGAEKRRICADLEIHIHPNAWVQHHHNTDKRYKNVRFHVVYFQGSEIPGLLQIPLQKIVAHDPAFSFENIDPTAYPYAVPHGSFPLKDMPIDRKIDWLESAGEERLRLKSARLLVAMQSESPEEILWQELMSALGYKNNKQPFRRLATLLPLQQLRTMVATPTEAYALLMGVSGLLPRNMLSDWSGETQQFVRQLWDIWWKKSGTFSSITLNKSDWRFQNLRPVNHPVRRLMAAAHYVFDIPDVAQNPEKLSTFPSTYWRTHLSWKKECSPTALVGRSRANAMITNVLIPWRAATNSVPIQFEALAREPLNHIIKQTAFALFGPDHTQKIYRSALARQGIIQVFYDYLLPRRMDELQHLFS